VLKRSNNATRANAAKQIIDQAMKSDVKKGQRVWKYRVGLIGVIGYIVITLFAFVFGSKKGAANSVNMFSVDEIFIVQEQNNLDLSNYYDDFSFIDRMKLTISTKYVFPVKGYNKVDAAEFLRRYKLSFVSKKDTAIYYVDIDRTLVVTNRFPGVYKSDYMLEIINDVVQSSR
jgi:hypothetical protein